MSRTTKGHGIVITPPLRPLRPIGDKVVIVKSDLKPSSENQLFLPTSVILCEVIAVGEGIPFGRGEFYSNTTQVGDLIFIEEQSFKKAPSIRISLTKGQDRPVAHAVVHEREILMVVDKEILS